MSVIKIIKLVTGEELIATVHNFCDSTSDKYLALTKIRIMGITQHQGQVMLQLIPFIKCDPDAEFKCNSHAIAGIMTSIIPADIEKLYLEQTSGIQLIK